MTASWIWAFQVSGPPQLLRVSLTIVYTCQDHVLESLILDSKYSKMTPKFVKQKSHWLHSSIKFANPERQMTDPSCKNVPHSLLLIWKDSRSCSVHQLFDWNKKAQSSTLSHWLHIFGYVAWQCTTIRVCLPWHPLGSSLSTSYPGRQEQKYDVLVSLQICWQWPL